MSPENLVGDLLQAALGSFARVGAPKVVAEHSALGLEGGVTLRNFQARNSLGEELVISVAEPRVRRFAVPVIAAHQTNDCGRRSGRSDWVRLQISSYSTRKRERKAHPLARMRL